MLTGLFHLISAALIVSGLDKVRSPRPSSTALRRAGFPGLTGAVGAVVPGVVLGVIETTAGVAALVGPGAISASGVAALYLLFALFVLRLRVVDSTAGCGCFGSSTAPPTITHLVVDSAACAVATATAVIGCVPTIVDTLGDGVGAAVPYAALLMIGSVLVLMGPALFSEVRTQPSAPVVAREFSLNEGR